LKRSCQAALCSKATAFCAVIITGAPGAVALPLPLPLPVPVPVRRDAGIAAPAPIKAAVIFGFMGWTILTLITAFAIGAFNSPSVGGVPDLCARMDLTGWSLSDGNLRVAHFLATHMMQAVQFATLLAASALQDRAKLHRVISVTVLWALWVLIEFHGALAGEAGLILRVVFG